MTKSSLYGGVIVVFLNDSFTVVLLGDWNKLYIQPEWIAHNVYEKTEIEIGVSGQGTDFSVTYRSDGVLIAPTQNQIKMTAASTDDRTIESIARCLNNFLTKATTPYLLAYGLNCEFIDDDNIAFAGLIDSISDNSTIIENGYEIKSAKVTRTLSKDDIILNLEMLMEEGRTIIRFNEHHGERVNKMPTISAIRIKEFLKSCKELVVALGYDLEGEN